MMKVTLSWYTVSTYNLKRIRWEIYMITFLPLKNEDLHLLLHWLEKPHIKKWWDSDIQWTYQKIVEKYGPRIDHTNQKNNHIFCYIIYHNITPIGYIQYYDIAHFSDDFPKNIISLCPQPCASFDMFIGEEEFCGKGIGNTIIQILIKKYVMPSFKSICALVSQDNDRALKSYQKAGLQSLTKLEMHVFLWTTW